ncbi:imidazolonepropionase [Pokkaliibacter sp. CJK22405]|uniref:imidazolonepropionase n=1 Tax=Pokkaliibacter sp. CJK22405 TaxID=3384615 RepID=UPI003984896E
MTDTAFTWLLNARPITMELGEEGYGQKPLSAIEIQQGKICRVIPMEEYSAAASDDAVLDLQGRYVTPGLIDCHTHLIYGGDRADEFERRLQGVPYSTIAKEGGGIASTVRATREATIETLVEAAKPRLEALLREGVTTIEIKSGYGLSLEDELKLLRAAKALTQGYSVRLHATFLGAHALPPEFVGRADDYITLVCDKMIPVVAAEQLADAVDVFCEGIAFSTEQTARVFDAAKAHGLNIKAHAEQLSLLGGSELVAERGGLSADHVEYLDEAGVRAMANAGTVAVLLPGAFYFLRETQLPPIELLREYSVPMALATDFNPGTSPLASLRLMMNMGCTLFRLTPEEVLRGVTQHAATALGQQGKLGQIIPGAHADLLVWDIRHPAELAYCFGVSQPLYRLFAGHLTPNNYS